MLSRPFKEQIRQNSVPEEELVSHFIRTGQNDYLAQLYIQCWDRVYRHCLSVVKDPDLAQDYTQDIFLKLISKISMYNGSGRFSTWLFSVTYNYCLEQRRNSKHKAALSIDNLPELVDDDTRIPYLHDEPCLVDRVMVAYSLLPAQEQRILEMRYQNNLSLSDISVRYQITLSAVKMRLLRSRKKLRDIYKGGSNL